MVGMTGDRIGASSDDPRENYLGYVEAVHFWSAGSETRLQGTGFWPQWPACARSLQQRW